MHESLELERPFAPGPLQAEKVVTIPPRSGMMDIADLLVKRDRLQVIGVGRFLVARMQRDEAVGGGDGREQRAAVIAQRKIGGEEIDTAGDGFLVLFDGPARAIRCALAIRDGIAELGLDVRAGVHTGEVERPRGGGPRGISVHTGARIAAAGSAGDVLVSATTRDLVAGSGLAFADRGEVELKGIGVRRLYAATA